MKISAYLIDSRNLNPEISLKLHSAVWKQSPHWSDIGGRSGNRLNSILYSDEEVYAQNFLVRRDRKVILVPYGWLLSIAYPYEFKNYSELISQNAAVLTFSSWFCLQLLSVWSSPGSAKKLYTIRHVLSYWRNSQTRFYLNIPVKRSI